MAYKPGVATPQLVPSPPTPRALPFTVICAVKDLFQSINYHLTGSMSPWAMQLLSQLSFPPAISLSLDSFAFLYRTQYQLIR